MDYSFKSAPYEHQRRHFFQDRDKEYYAYLWEMGVGKTKIIIDTASWLWSQGEIQGLLIAAPNGVHQNWIWDEIDAHMPDHILRYSVAYVSSPNAREERNLAALYSSDALPLKVLAMNFEAFASKRGQAEALKFLLSFKSLFVIDESDGIKDIDANRTKFILDKLKPHAAYRRILTGTPVPEGPLNLYSQFEFLDSDILGQSSYYGFRNRYAVMEEVVLREIDPKTQRPRRFKSVVGYQRLDELQALIAPYSSRITKDECLDLPEKIYEKRYVQLSDNQKKLYNDLKRDMYSEYEGVEISVDMAMTLMLRLQQIVGGFVTPDQEVMLFGDTEVPERAVARPIDAKNKRIEALLEILDGVGGKAIIWARFRPELDAIAVALKAKYGRSAVSEYHGGIEDEDRPGMIHRFQGRRPVIDPVTHSRTGWEDIPKEEQTRWFVANPQSAGTGLTLTAATTVIYYSNSFSLRMRQQSEDRAHRIGQLNKVTYIDMIAQGTVDEHIVKALRGKVDIARAITGDSIREWI